MFEDFPARSDGPRWSKATKVLIGTAGFCAIAAVVTASVGYSLLLTGCAFILSFVAWNVEQKARRSFGSDSCSGTEDVRSGEANSIDANESETVGGTSDESEPSPSQDHMGSLGIAGAVFLSLVGMFGCGFALIGSQGAHTEAGGFGAIAVGVGWCVICLYGAKRMIS